VFSVNLTINKQALPLVGKLMFRITVGALVLSFLGWWLKGMPTILILVTILILEVSGLIISASILFSRGKD
jgi:hypothetical protein